MSSELAAVPQQEGRSPFSKLVMLEFLSVVVFLVLLWSASIQGFVPQLSKPATWQQRWAFQTSSSSTSSSDPHSIHRLLKPAPENTNDGFFIETWCVVNMERVYRKALSAKCPFMRRRYTDFLDLIDTIIRIAAIFPGSRRRLGPPIGLRCEGETCIKQRYLQLEEVANILRKDWREDNRRGYYITGKLNTAVYRDDCLFDGPDPDMPIRGLRKYLKVASQLFDQAKSRSELLSLEIVDNLIVAKWRLNGILRLPWRPTLPEVTGTTTYYRDEQGLIYRHKETWDISVAQAFFKTLWPDLADRFEGGKDEEEECIVS